jgi:hypothetical protein
MKRKLIVLMIAVALASAAPAWAKTVLPDACGDDKVKFGVKTERPPSKPAGPANGKSLVVLIEDGNLIGAFMVATVRYGMDGAWVGANTKHSYFSFEVDPGEHHLCASWQSIGAFKSSVGMQSFIAEAGKTYYFASDASAEHTQGGGYNFEFSQLDDDDGKYRVKAYKVSKFKSNR